MTVHTRRAVQVALETLADVSGSVVLHWFTGTTAEAKKAVSRGWRFSVNSAMLDGAKGRSLIASIPQNLVLTETDGPFAKVGSRPSRPVDVLHVVDQLASIWNVEHEEARTRVLENFRRCLSMG